MAQEKKYLDWTTVEELIEILASKIREEQLKPFAQILAIPRGGFIPATMLAHHLNIDTVRGVVAQSSIYKSTLLVDDINHGGRTLELWSRYYPKVPTACLISRTSSTFKPTFVGQEVPYDNWIVFPWETDAERDETEYRRNRHLTTGIGHTD